MTVSGNRVLPVFLGVVAMATLALSALPINRAFAAQITSRSLTLQGVGSDGGSKPGGTVNHIFTFTIPGGASTIKSMKFTYCTKAREQTCTPPTDMSASGASLDTTTGTTGWTMGTATANTVVITNSTGTTFSSSTVTIPIDGVLNPSSINTAFYVDIGTFTSTDGSGTPVDEGWVAAATANQIQLTGTMPESLIFCTADSIDSPGGIPDCASALSADVTFNQLFSPTDTAYATSQMAASTNAANGYAITVAGNTMTSGSNTITAISGGPSASVKGTSQFGINLVKNADFCGSGCDVGDDITPASTISTLRGEATADYATASSFKFVPAGDTVADSYHPSPGGTDMQLYTVSYIVNVDGAQAAGTYQTTLTYVCTSTF